MNRGLIYEKALEHWQSVAALLHLDVARAQQRLAEAEDRIAYWQRIRAKVEDVDE